jgi:hypothetical protein
MQQQPPQRRGDDGQPSDPKIDEFLRRAATAIAEGRGINPQSLARIDAIAEEIGLSPEKKQRALRALQPKAAGDEKEQRRRKRAYENFVGEQLIERASKLLPGSVKQRLIGAGIQEFDLPRSAAEAAVEEIASALSIAFASQQDLTRYVESQVQEAVGSASRLSTADRKQLKKLAAECGLEADQVDALIRRHERRNARTKGMMVLVGLVALALVAGVVAVLASRNREGPAVSDDGGAKAPPATTLSQEWWDATITVALLQIREQDPSLAPLLRQLSSDDPSYRGDGYEQLVRPNLWPTDGSQSSGDKRSDAKATPAAGGAKDGQPAPAAETARRRLFGELVAGCHALDPADEAAGRLRRELLASIALPATAEASKASGSSIDADRVARATHAFRSLSWAIEALARSDLGPERRSELTTELGGLLGTTIDGAKDRPALTALCFGALAEQAQRRIASLAASQVEAAWQLRGAVRQEIATVLLAEALEALDVAFLEAALLGRGPYPQSALDLASAVIAKGTPAGVLRMVDVLERAVDPTVKQFLLAALGKRVGDSELSPEELAAAVRKDLSGKARAAPATPADRQNAFSQAAIRLLAGAPATADKEHELLQELLELAHANALGCALAQGPQGHAAFDGLMADGAVRLTPIEKPGSKKPRPGGMLGAMEQNQAAAERLIANWQNARHSLTSLPALAQHAANGVSDISLRPAYKLSEYLLTMRPKAEHEVILQHIKALAGWPHVRMGLADQLDAATAPPEQLAQRLSAVLEQQMQPEKDAAWRQKARVALLKGVADELPRSAVASRTPRLDVVAESLRQLWQEQAKLWGLDSSQYDAAPTPGQTLRIVVEHVAQRLSGKELRPADRAWVGGLTHELAAIDYLRRNDLQLTALLQRTYLKLLATDLASRRPQTALDADKVISDLRGLDSKTTAVLVQLRDGEAALLKLWSNWHSSALQRGRSR